MRLTWIWMTSLLLAGCVDSKSGEMTADSDDGGSTGSSVSASDDASTGAVASQSCPGQAPNATIQGASFDESLATFESQRDAAGGKYWYRVQRGFDEWGPTPNCLYETLIVVEGGTVIRREFALVDQWEDASGYPECEPVDVVEEDADIGASDFPHAATPWTLEQLYTTCCDEMLSVEPAEEYYIGFYTFEDGLLQGCGRSSVNCADGCGEHPAGYNGEIRLSEIGFGPPPG